MSGISLENILRVQFGEVQYTRPKRDRNNPQRDENAKHRHQDSEQEDEGEIGEGNGEDSHGEELCPVSPAKKSLIAEFSPEAFGIHSAMVSAADLEAFADFGWANSMPRPAIEPALRGEGTRVLGVKLDVAL